MVLTGQTHISRQQFAQTISDAYNQTILLHFDSLTAGGKVVNSAPKLLPLYNGILTVCEMNIHQHNQVNFLQQLGPYIQTYWAGIIIVGPTGTVTVTSPGSFTGIPVPPNNNFNIILNAMIAAFKIHIMTLVGTYVSSVVPGVVSPWSGAMLQTIP
jgi:hypothetical protein